MSKGQAGLLSMTLFQKKKKKKKAWCGAHIYNLSYGETEIGRIVV
jgi:hypothetical protein